MKSVNRKKSCKIKNLTIANFRNWLFQNLHSDLMGMYTPLYTNNPVISFIEETTSNYWIRLSSPHHIDYLTVEGVKRSSLPLWTVRFLYYVSLTQANMQDEDKRLCGEDLLSILQYSLLPERIRRVTDEYKFGTPLVF